MNFLSSKFSAGFAGLPPAEANAAFEAARAKDGREPGPRLVVIDPAGELAFVAPLALDLFEAPDAPGLAARLLKGDSPLARRMRRLIATLPAIPDTRLERVRVPLRRGYASLNLAVRRVIADDGRPLVAVWRAEETHAGPSLPAGPAMPDASPPTRSAGSGKHGRFLWSFSSDGRFAVLDAALAGVLGDSAPGADERLDALRRRLAITNAEGLAQAFAAGETFSALAIGWPLPSGEVVHMTLSGMPTPRAGASSAPFRGFGYLEAWPVQGPPAPTAGPAQAVLAPAAASDRPAESPSSDVQAAKRAGAEIYVLRHPSAAAKVVPIRPDVSPEDGGRSEGRGGAVELSRSERDAFREIARSLIEKPSPQEGKAPDANPAGPSDPPRASGPQERPEPRAPRRAESLENPLAHAGDLLRALDVACDGAALLDGAGTILRLSDKAERLFGVGREAEGDSLLSLIGPQSRAETAAAIEAARRSAEGGGSVALRAWGRAARGALAPLELTLATLGASQFPAYWVLFREANPEVARDRKLLDARDAAQAASEAKTEFLAQISHEIRTPLHAILGFAEVMIEERFGPIGNDRYRDYVKDIHASAAHVMSLANDLLDLAKIEAGKLELSFAAVDLNGVIRECASLMQTEAARNRIIMRLSLCETLAPAVVDQRALRQIMLNLISNAVKYNEPGGQVIVSTALDAAGQAVIRVRDTGPGMSEAEIGIALQPFGRVDDQARRSGGAGLGLPLTKALVEANNAEFTIRSQPKQGTLVEIAFRNAQAAQ